MAQEKISSHSGNRSSGLIAAVLAGLLMAASLPAAATTPRFGDGFGVNVKSERITPAELNLIAQIGIKRIRTGISWYTTERQKGEYRWDFLLHRHISADDYNEKPHSSYEIFFEQVISRGLQLDVTLHEGNTLYTGEPVNIAAAGAPESFRIPAPRTPEAIQGFAAFAAQTVAHFHARHGSAPFTWHIWNEPDMPGGFPPTTDAAKFGELLTTTCQAIRAVDKDARIMGPALGAKGDGDIDHSFIHAMLSHANALPCLNGFTIHPYRSAAPETAPADYAQVRETLAPFQPKDKPPVPIATDEWGYSINRHHGELPLPLRWRDFSGEEQAALMLRMYLTNLAANLLLTVIYDWRDRGEDPYEWEDHFGIMGFKGEEKPALKMFRSLWPLLRDRPLLTATTPDNCSTTLHRQTFGVREADDTYWQIIWSSGAPQTVTLAGTPLRLMDIFGAPLAMPDNQRTITITGRPILLAMSAPTAVQVSCAP